MSLSISHQEYFQPAYVEKVTAPPSPQSTDEKTTEESVSVDAPP